MKRIQKCLIWPEQFAVWKNQSDDLIKKFTKKCILDSSRTIQGLQDICCVNCVSAGGSRPAVLFGLAGCCQAACGSALGFGYLPASAWNTKGALSYSLPTWNNCRWFVWTLNLKMISLVKGAFSSLCQWTKAAVWRHNDKELEHV